MPSPPLSPCRRRWPGRASRARSPRGRAKMKRMKILVVDDERAVRDSLRRALELEGYEIELADNGREALDRLASGSEPDALVLDVLMPGVDGLEVCRTLRRNGSRLPVLMLTARTQVE